jgi:hypothetical protein
MIPTSRPHGLPGELILSLTSYPPRFPTLHLALEPLLRQSVAPDRTILWIAAGDLHLLPNAVHRLQERGLEIRPCADLRSFKKLLPALEAFPGAFIATADDDIAYPPDLIERLVDGVDPRRRVITCNRAHRMKRDPDGTIAPFGEWQFNVIDEAASQPSADLLPVGVAGILYPPGALDPIVADSRMFERLCPHGDDLWFYWCARRAGTLHRKVGGRMLLPLLPGSQDSNLWHINLNGGNDRMIAALQAELGPPELAGSATSG